jgi:hypothetical protein
MKKEFLIIILTLLISMDGIAQLMDKYGLNIGATFSNQKWTQDDFHLFHFDSHKMGYKTGLSVFFSAEKNLNKVISFRPELGYIQKGFKNNTNILSFSREQPKGNVVFHEFGFNFGLKIKPFHYKWSPYTFIGSRFDYMLAYSDIVTKDLKTGEPVHIYKTLIDELTKLGIGALISIGIEKNDLFYIELEYNPELNRSRSPIKMTDNCLAIKLGLNINKMNKNKESSNN